MTCNKKEKHQCHELCEGRNTPVHTDGKTDGTHIHQDGDGTSQIIIPQDDE